MIIFDQIVFEGPAHDGGSASFSTSGKEVGSAVNGLTLWANAWLISGLLGHRSLASTEAYLKSLTDREVWGAFQAAIAAA